LMIATAWGSLRLVAIGDSTKGGGVAGDKVAKWGLLTCWEGEMMDARVEMWE